jgi:putative DNA primase/helicase
MIHAADVAGRLALRRHAQSWRGPCPCCGYAGGTFTIREGKDGRVRLWCANGCNGYELEKAIATATGQQPPAPTRATANAAEDQERKRERALALWRGSEPALNTLAHRYLISRKLPGLANSSALRFRGDTPHPEGGKLPALIALVTDVAGRPVGIHRTYLARDGSKAPVEPNKASLGPTWGAAIRLDPVIAGAALVVGEGIESSASAGRLMGLPAWAGMSAGNLARGLMLTPEIRWVVVATDADPAGRDAARNAWLRWRAEGRDVQIAIPDRNGRDFNDLLLSREALNA